MFNLQPNGVVVDTVTNLMWCRFAYGQTWANGTAVGTPTRMLWTATTNAVGAFNTNVNNGTGYNDWRLPTIKELQTIVDKTNGTVNNLIDSIAFPNSHIKSWGENYYWTSAPSPAISGKAGCAIRFEKTGNALVAGQHFCNPVRFVRTMTPEEV